MSETNDEKTNPDKNEEKIEEKKEPKDNLVVTKHAVTIGGKKVEYTVTTGEIILKEELDDRDKSLKKTQEALVQSEKMSAFGQLGAGIAHEVKNPLAGILGLAQLSLRKTGEDSPIRQNLTLIESETKRCQKS